MKPGWGGKYREGVKGRCFWCRRKEGEHQEGRCPGWSAGGPHPGEGSDSKRRHQLASRMDELVNEAWYDVQD